MTNTFKIGDLVKYNRSEYGVIVEVSERPGTYQVYFESEYSLWAEDWMLQVADNFDIQVTIVAKRNKVLDEVISSVKRNAAAKIKELKTSKLPYPVRERAYISGY